MLEEREQERGGGERMRSRETSRDGDRWGVKREAGGRVRGSVGMRKASGRRPEKESESEPTEELVFKARRRRRPPR